MSSKPVKQTKSEKRKRRVPTNFVNPIMQPGPNTRRASSKIQLSDSIQLRSTHKRIKVKEATEINEDLTTSTKVDCQPSGSSSHVDENISNLQAVVGSSSTPLPRLRVLSLFDGLGTGYLTLTELGYDIEVYYASEIDPEALLLTRSHFANNIKQLGSVVNIDEAMLEQIGPINLLIGGSPCTELSCVNHLRKGLFNPEGSGVLFFEYYRILDILRKKSVIGNYKFFWLFENVKNMENANKQTIAFYLDCQTYVIDSIYVSPQHRERYFWSNIPDIEKHGLVKDKDLGPKLDDYLDRNLGRRANVKKICTLTTKQSCLQDGKSRNPVIQDGEISDLYITEIEEIFGFPIHYTDVGNMNNRQRHRLLGKAWSAQVVKLIFKSLNNHFALKRDDIK